MEAKPSSGLTEASGSAEQPHAFWARLRAECPVARVEELGSGAPPTYLVARWAEANQVLRDPETYSSSINAERTGQFMGPVLLAMDGERHRSRRLIIAHAFRTSQLAVWERMLVRPIITQLCDSVVTLGRAELIEAVISRFPVLVICGMCAIPAEDSPRFLQWAIDIHRGMIDPAVGSAAAQAMRAYLEPIVEDRRCRPGDDLISDIVHSEVDGGKLDDEEIYAFLRLLLPAGSESTYRTMSSALLAMLRAPDLLTRARTDVAALNAIVEETLRWDVANTMVSRVATRDAVLGGCPIPAGTPLRVLTSSANRDEAQFVQADIFDSDRPARRHLAFGLGPHQCLGQPLARMEMRVGLETILSKLPNLRLDPAYPAPVIKGTTFRGPDSLYVMFGAR